MCLEHRAISCWPEGHFTCHEQRAMAQQQEGVSWQAYEEFHFNV